MPKSSSPGEDRGQRQGQAREINFGDHALVLHDGAGGVLHAVGEVHPGKKRAVIENRVGDAFGGDVGEASEERG